MGRSRNMKLGFKEKRAFMKEARNFLRKVNPGHRKDTVKTFCEAGKFLSKRKNWVKDTFQEDDLNLKEDQVAPVCLLGSVGTNSSFYNGTPSDTADELLTMYIRQFNVRDGEPEYEGIPDFNDARQTTHREVLQVLDETTRLSRRAIRQLEKEG